jgi:hypothetical protein
MWATLRFDAATLGAGYLVAGWRGAIVALILREIGRLMAPLILAVVARRMSPPT